VRRTSAEAAASIRMFPRVKSLDITSDPFHREWNYTKVASLEEVSLGGEHDLLF
jgi:hypothetical protein